MRVQIHAGSSLNHGNDQRAASSRLLEDMTIADLQNELHCIGVEYKTADYYATRQVVIVIQPDDIGEDPRDAAIARLRSALIATGVKPGLVTAIQEGEAFSRREAREGGLPG